MINITKMIKSKIMIMIMRRINNDLCNLRIVELRIAIVIMEIEVKEVEVEKAGNHNISIKNECILEKILI